MSWIRSRLFDPVLIGGRTLPSIGLLALAAIGAVLLAVVASASWFQPTDEQAYWRAAERLAAGLPVYNSASVPGDASFGYWYPPPLAQVLAPFTAILSPTGFTVAWTALLLVCLWWLAGRNVLIGLALVAFLPVAVELRSRNVHLVLAVLVVLALRRSWVFWIPAAAIKVTPVLGALYLAAAGRLREAFGVMALGAAVLGLSALVSPGVWHDFLSIVVTQAGSSEAALLPIPFAFRAAAGAVVAVIAGRVGGRRGELLLVVALVVANPTLWVTALSLLVAIVPLIRTRPSEGLVASQPTVAPAGLPS